MASLNFKSWTTALAALVLTSGACKQPLQNGKQQADPHAGMHGEPHQAFESPPTPLFAALLPTEVRTMEVPPGWELAAMRVIERIRYPVMVSTASGAQTEFRALSPSQAGEGRIVVDGPIHLINTLHDAVMHMVSGPPPMAEPFGYQTVIYTVEARTTNAAAKEPPPDFAPIVALLSARPELKGRTFSLLRRVTFSKPSGQATISTADATYSFRQAFEPSGFFATGLEIRDAKGTTVISTDWVQAMEQTVVVASTQEADGPIRLVVSHIHHVPLHVER